MMWPTATHQILRCALTGLAVLSTGCLSRLKRDITTDLDYLTLANCVQRIAQEEGYGPPGAGQFPVIVAVRVYDVNAINQTSYEQVTFKKQLTPDSAWAEAIVKAGSTRRWQPVSTAEGQRVQQRTPQECRIVRRNRDELRHVASPSS